MVFPFPSPIAFSGSCPQSLLALLFVVLHQRKDCVALKVHWSPLTVVVTALAALAAVCWISYLIFCAG